MSQAQEALVYCEACNLPHRTGIVRCQGCGHTLGETPNWDEVKDKALVHKRLAGVAAIVTVVSVCVTVLWLGEGTPFYALLPFLWLGFHLYQVFTLGNRLPKP